ncbi:MAG: membrane protein insertion efficiency factor YidD [Deltaproteobacteria bacterium]|nr:membrane protein insertion efficiency factor YidD [Deltaproteobacteria bacterium]
MSIAGVLAGCASTGAPGKEQPPAPARALLSFYDKGLNHLSSVRSGTCPMHPSCSAYSREAFGKHGLVKGWWMTFDRLLRCDPDEVERSPRVLVRGTWKAYDPVSRNDRWWHESPEEPPSTRRTP